MDRSHAPPLVSPKPGLPLIRSVPNLGYQAVRIKGTIDVESWLKPETKKKKLRWAFQRFVDWMRKEGSIYKGGLVIHGPFPHAEFKEPSWQTGDRGERRLVGHDLREAVGKDDREDYVIEATFVRKEQIQWVDRDVAQAVEGKRGIRLARPKDLEGIKKGKTT